MSLIVVADLFLRPFAIPLALFPEFLLRLLIVVVWFLPLSHQFLKAFWAPLIRLSYPKLLPFLNTLFVLTLLAFAVPFAAFSVGLRLLHELHNSRIPYTCTIFAFFFTTIFLCCSCIVFLFVSIPLKFGYLNVLFFLFLFALFAIRVSLRIGLLSAHLPFHYKSQSHFWHQCKVGEDVFRILLYFLICFW